MCVACKGMSEEVHTGAHVFPINAALCERMKCSITEQRIFHNKVVRKSLKNYYFVTQINPTHLSQAQHAHTHFDRRAFLALPIRCPRASLATYLLAGIIADVKEDDKKRKAIHRTYTIWQRPCSSRMYLLCLCCRFFVDVVGVPNRRPC